MSSKTTAILALAAAAIALATYLPSLSSYDHFHRDEANWIAISEFSFRAFFVDRDFHHRYWSLPMNTFGCYNPNVAKYIIGASLWMHGEREYRGMVRWRSSRDLDWHIREGMAPSRAELRAARLPVMILTAGMAALLVALVAMARGTRRGAAVGAAAAAAFFLAHPLVREGGRRAMIDMPAAAFSLAALVLAATARARLLGGHRWRGLLCGAGAAVCAGLATGSKLNAGLVVAVVGIVALETWIRKRDRYTAANILFAVLLPPAIFVGLDPYLWNDTAEGVRTMIEFGAIVAGRVDKYPDAALTDFAARLHAFRRMVFPHAAFAWFSAASALALLFVERGRAFAVCVWTAVIVAGTLLWAPFAWDRYYIPAVPVAAFLVGYGAAFLAGAARRFVPGPKT